jgi:hypothetical protein
MGRLAAMGRYDQVSDELRVADPKPHLSLTPSASSRQRASHHLTYFATGHAWPTLPL